MNNSDLIQFAKAFCLIDSRGGTLADCAVHFGQTAKALVPIVRQVCAIPEVARRIGHWPQESGGAIYVANKAKIGSSCRARNGEHVHIEKLSGGFFEITGLDGRYLGTANTRALERV